MVFNSPHFQPFLSTVFFTFSNTKTTSWAPLVLYQFLKSSVKYQSSFLMETHVLMHSMCVVTQQRLDFCVFIFVSLRGRGYKKKYMLCRRPFISGLDPLLMPLFWLWLTTLRDERGRVTYSPTLDHLSESAGSQLMMFKINSGAIDFASRIYAS